MSGRCDRVTPLLPSVVDGSLPRWRRRLVDRHLEGCDACAADLARQRVVTQGLAVVRDVEQAGAAAPPEGLLDTLLAQAQDPGLRGRVAVPARGAISGARPKLTIAFAAVAVALLVLGGWAGWRLGRAVGEARRR